MTVLIVGAGPTGLTAALVLAANGVPVRIIDARPEPSPASRALGLQARSMEMLAGLGVAERVEQVATRLSGASIMKGNRPLVDMAWRPPESPFPHTYVVPQAGLEAILRGRLEEDGISVERGTTLADLATEEHSVVATMDDGRTITADWLIGADGARSRVRDSSDIGLPRHMTGEVYHLADALIDLPEGLGRHLDRVGSAQDPSDSAGSGMWLGPHGPLMLMALPGDRRLWRVFVDMTDTAAGGDLPELTAPLLDRLLAERGPRGARTEALLWTSVFRTRVGLADRYRAGRVFLAGDAAHVFPPFGGQGMNLGIQDAVNLCWRLAGVVNGAPQALLDGYEQERRQIAAATIKEVETRRRMYALRNPVARGLRDLVLRVGAASQAAERRASLQNSQLGNNYRHVIRSRSKRRPGPQPGDRAPDGQILDSRLHELIGPDHVILLILDPEQDVDRISRQPGVITVIATGQELRRRYGLRDGERDLLLIRPDGHIQSRDLDPETAGDEVRALIGQRLPTTG